MNEMPKVQAKTVSVELERIAPYLPGRHAQTKEPVCEPIGYCGAVLSVFTGSFLSIDDKEDEGVKDSLFNESANIGIVSALLLTLVIPMAFENVSDIAEGQDAAIYEGALGEMLDVTNDFAKVYASIMHLSFYFSSWLFVLSLFASFFMLLGANELDEDSFVEYYLKLMRASKLNRVPALLMVFGSLVLGMGISLRCLLTAPMTWSLVVTLVGAAIIISIMCAFITLHVKYMFQTVHENTRYWPLDLTQDEVESDMSKFMEKERDPSLRKALRALSCKAPSGALVPLGNLCKQRAVLAYHQKVFNMLGIQTTKHLDGIALSESSDATYLNIKLAPNWPARV